MSENSVETLRALWDELHTRLKAESADYRTLLALEADMRTRDGAETSPALVAGDGRGSALDLAVRVTRADAVERILQVRGEPLATDELMALLPAFGAPTGSRGSLSSSLSQAPQFVSIRYGNRWCWWLAGRRVRPEGAQTDQLTPGTTRPSRWRQMRSRRTHK